MGAFLGILSSLLKGIGTVGGAIGSNIGRVGEAVGGNIANVGKAIGSNFQNVAAGGAPVGGIWQGPGGDAGSNGLPQGGLGGLFQNKLLAQLLGATGQDLLANTPGKNLGGALQQNVASQNYAKMLSQVLGGGTPPPGVKHTIDGGAEAGTHKRTISIDHSIFDPSVGDVPQAKTPPIQPTDWLQAGLGPGLGAANPFPTSQPATTAPAGAEAQVPTVAPAATTSDPMLQMLTQLLGGNQVNLGAGFANLRPSDLAGVSPEMMSQALQFKMQQEQLGKKNVLDVMDLMMRGQELGIRAPYMKALTDEAIDRVAANQPVVQIGGIPYNTSEYLKWQQVQKENLSTNQKDYASYAAQEAANGRTPKSFEEFLNNNFTADIKNYRLYTEQEKAAGRVPKDFDPWLSEHEGSRATRITVGEAAGKAAAIHRATSMVDAQAEVSDPSKREAFIQKSINNLPFDSQLTLTQGTPAEVSQIKNITAADAIEKQIIGAGGRIVGRQNLPKAMTWKVVWPPAAEGEKERSETITHPKY
jgi:hypothetical protein